MLNIQQPELQNSTMNQNKLCNRKTIIYTNTPINAKLYATPDQQKFDSFKYNYAYVKNYSVDSTHYPSNFMQHPNKVPIPYINAFNTNPVGEVSNFNDIGNSINLSSGGNVKMISSLW